MWILALPVGVVGLVIGSFLNVVIWRVPREESVVRPASRCPGCGNEIRRYDNVPVVSWLFLHGKCRDCGQRISPRYPLVELATGVLFAITAWHFGASWSLPAYLYLVAIGVTLSMIDIDVHRLPNPIVLPSYVVGAGLLVLASATAGDWHALVRAAIGGVALFVIYFALCFAYPKGMGFGDVKLAGVLGMYLAWLGWGEWAVGAFLGFLLGGVIGGALMAVGRATRKSKIPFGPFMISGAFLAVVVGAQISRLYLDTIS